MAIRQGCLRLARKRVLRGARTRTPRAASWTLCAHAVSLVYSLCLAIIVESSRVQSYAHARFTWIMILEAMRMKLSIQWIMDGVIYK